MKRKNQRTERADHDTLLYQIGRLDDEIHRNSSEYLSADKNRDWDGVRLALKLGSRLWDEREKLVRQMRGI